MGDSKKCIVAGFPIEHSLSLHLFSLVHEHLGISCKETKKISTNDFEEIFRDVQKSLVSEEYQNLIKKITEEIQGENIVLQLIDKIKIIHYEKEFDGTILWGSITSPLKHQLGATMNCFTLDERGLRTSMTDGFGVVLAAQQFGIDFDVKPVLCLKGGGSASAATANAWLSMGGVVRAIRGRRALPTEILEKCDLKSDPDLYIDFDDSSDSEHLVLFPKYDSEIVISDNKIDGRWMLVAQHLLSWAVLFAPEKKNDLPSAELLFKRLILLESML